MLTFEIDWLPWPMESAVRQHVWPLWVDWEWTGPLRKFMGATWAAPTLVFEVWHAQEEVLLRDLTRA